MEDVVILEAQQEIIESSPDAPTIDISADGSTIPVRRLIQSLLDAEAAAKDASRAAAE